MVFHTIPEYEEWKESLGAGGTKGWDIKYYKGLGTSTNDEAREYFANIEGNRKEFVWTGGRPMFRSNARPSLTARTVSTSSAQHAKARVHELIHEMVRLQRMLHLRCDHIYRQDCMCVMQLKSIHSARKLP